METAVEWLINELKCIKSECGNQIVKIDIKEKLLEQAKAKERSQKAEEYLKGFKDGKDYQIKLDELTFKTNKMKQKEEHKQETLEEATETIGDFIKRESISASESVGIVKGAKWQQEKMYSEEEVYHILIEHTAFLFKGGKSTLTEWFEQFSKLKNG